MRTVEADVAVFGAGPAGLFAAERLGSAGLTVAVFDRMASPARKLLMAGRGGLNLTHSEPRAAFLARYGAAADRLAAALDAFPPAALRGWAAGLGEETFVGTSGRVFPRSFKASPLLRAWLRRLDGLGVRLFMRHRLVGLTAEGAPEVEGPEGPVTVSCRAVLLALGGASWPRLGSDGAWVAPLKARGVPVAPLVPANMGLDIGWSPVFAERHAGAPLKGIAVAVGGATARGEAMITATGLEGGAIYAVSAAARRALAEGGGARLVLDLKPDLAPEAAAARLARARPKDTAAARLRKTLALSPAAAALVREAAGAWPATPEETARLIKALPLTVTAARPLDRAISSAGGIALGAVGPDGALAGLPNVFAAGEMLDWEAPTGGYLLQATFATADAAARGIAARLGRPLAALGRGW